MKRTLIIVVFTIFGLKIFGQDRFTYNQQGLSPTYIVTEIPGLNQAALFDKAILWIKETYRNPDKVIKTTVEKEMIRFEGFQDYGICTKTGLGGLICHDVFYTIELEFRDNKFKFTPVELRQRVPVSQYSAGGFLPIDLRDGSGYYNKQGSLRNIYETVPTSIEMLFNEFNSRISLFLSSEKDESEGW